MVGERGVKRMSAKKGEKKKERTVVTTEQRELTVFNLEFRI